MVTTRIVSIAHDQCLTEWISVNYVGIACSDPFPESQAVPRQDECSEKAYDYDYVDTEALVKITGLPLQKGDSSLYYASKLIAPPVDDSQGKMVVGGDDVSLPKTKPAVPPKPTKKQLCTNSSKESSTADSTGGSADTSTGDSGFVDARKYLKERRGPPPKVPPRHSYTPLNASEREQVADYTELKH